MDDDPLLTIPEAAKLLELSRQQVYNLIKAKRLVTETLSYRGPQGFKEYLGIRKSKCVHPPQKKRGRKLPPGKEPHPPKKPRLKPLKRKRKAETRITS